MILEIKIKCNDFREKKNSACRYDWCWQNDCGCCLSDRLRSQIADSITPTVLGIGTEEDNTLRESIKSALGVDLWK